MGLCILHVASECAPFAKVGGLGDVVHALPIATAALGHDVRVLLPRYDWIDTRDLRKHARPLGIPLGEGQGEVWCAVYEKHIRNVTYYFLEHDAFYARGYVYDPKSGFTSDNLLRFGTLCRAAFQIARSQHFMPDIFHAHDWPCALLPVMLNTTESEVFGGSASVLTIHNLAHQPRFPLWDLLNLDVPASEFRGDSLESEGAVHPLKGGLYHATKLTTVSPTYAREIRTPAGGVGLDPVLDFRGADFVGILNGIDAHEWNPETDPYLPTHFSARDLAGKAKCKRALLREVGLGEMGLSGPSGKAKNKTPLVAMVSRLNEQKGMDVMLAAMPELLKLDAQWVVLGAGDSELEQGLRNLAEQFPDQLRVHIGFDEGLAHRIEAGADVFLMPSRYEPCGLNQMYSQRYGTLPIVRATGGLVDTVTQCDLENSSDNKAGTGFLFNDLTPEALVNTVGWALEIWRKQPETWRRMQQAAMSRNFDWSVSAKEYVRVYEWALAAKRG